MQNSKYLPIGSVVGGHYEIVEVLGEDDFEILYLVKDKHRGETLSILKELFIKALSLRDKKEVYAFAKSKYVFEETKKEVIAEVIVLQEKNSSNSIQVYGYFEDNNTVYTIMEFMNGAKAEEYLKLQNKEEEEEQNEEKEIVLPPLERVEDLEEKPKSFFFLKVLVFSLLTFLILGLYAYKMLKEDKEKIQEKTPEPTSVVKQKVMPHPTLTHRTTIIEEPKESEVKEITEEEITEEEIIEVAVPKVVKQEVPINRNDRFNRTSIKHFLDVFIASSSNGLVTDIVSHYDEHVDRYFSLRNINHAQIQNDKRRYNRRWTERNFEIVNFKIINIYQKNSEEYCEVKTTTKWNVSTPSGKNASGTSRGLMTIKNRVDGFKVTSIYTVK
jgi:hypothetical protein